jgi:hypothetical protein
MNRCQTNLLNSTKTSLQHLKVYIVLTWLLILTYNIHFNPNSKYKYYVKSNAQYMRSFDKYKNESLISLDLMQQWLKENNIEKPIFNKLLNRNQKNILCVGIMSMRRVMSSSFKLKHRFYTIQTVVSLLTRVQFKYQDRIAINIFNLNRNKSIALDEHRDLMLLDNLIQIINIDMPPTDKNTSVFKKNYFVFLKVTLFFL